MLDYETLFLRIAVLGTGKLILTMPSSIGTLPTIETVKNFTTGSNWSIIEIELTSNQNGVAVLYVSTTTRCWVDQIQRIV